MKILRAWNSSFPQGAAYPKIKVYTLETPIGIMEKKMEITIMSYTVMSYTVVIYRGDIPQIVQTSLI